MKFCVLGNREFSDINYVFKILGKLDIRMSNKGKPLTKYVSFNWPGVDAISLDYAKKMGLSLEVFTSRVFGDVIDTYLEKDTLDLVCFFGKPLALPKQIEKVRYTATVINEDKIKYSTNSERHSEIERSASRTTKFKIRV